MTYGKAGTLTKTRYNTYNVNIHRQKEVVENKVYYDPERKPFIADRDIMEYPTEINNTGRVWSFK